MTAQGENHDTSSISWEPWIQTHTGKKFHFVSGPVTEVDIQDIATALSRVPRWAGHTTKFYSAAQHCVNTSLLVRERGGDNLEQKKAELHDAQEAYMCDLPSPLKRMIPRYKEIENKVWSKISRALLGKVHDIDGLVKECDITMLITEARDLFSFPPIDDWVAKCNRNNGNPPWEKTIVPCGPEKAKKLFLERWEELNGN